MKADHVCVTVSQDLIALYYVLSDEFSSHFQNIYMSGARNSQLGRGDQEAEVRRQESGVGVHKRIDSDGRHRVKTVAPSPARA